MENREKYIEKFKAKMDEWRSDIDKLEAKARGATANAKIKYEKELETLKKYYNEAGKKLDNLQRSGREKWEELRHETEEVSKKLKSAIDQYRSNTKDDNKDQ